MTETKTFIRLLKQHTDIDRKFIDTFFKKFQIGHELDFVISDQSVAEYLELTTITIHKRLKNSYARGKLFYENVDFIKVKGNGKVITYMMNYPCFERLVMGSDSAKSEVVRGYFVKLREFLVENQRAIYQAMEQKEDLKQYAGYETIYFFAVNDKQSSLLKVGRTTDIVRRLRNYNVGRIPEVDLKYLAIVKNSMLIEKCVKMKLGKCQVMENREIFEVSPASLKKVIDECYCKYVSQKENEELYREIGQLVGLYAYTKDKVHIKPYIIISKVIT